MPSHYRTSSLAQGLAVADEEGVCVRYSASLPVEQDAENKEHTERRGDLSAGKEGRHYAARDAHKHRNSNRPSIQYCPFNDPRSPTGTKGNIEKPDHVANGLNVGPVLVVDDAEAAVLA